MLSYAHCINWVIVHLQCPLSVDIKVKYPAVAYGPQAASVIRETSCYQEQIGFFQKISAHCDEPHPQQLAGRKLRNEFHWAAYVLIFKSNTSNSYS